MTDSPHRNHAEKANSPEGEEGTRTLAPDFYRMIREVEQELSKKEANRESVLRLGRNIRRASTALISAIHHRSVAANEFEPIKEMIDELHEQVTDHFDLFHAGFTENALQEYCEARILHALVTGERPADPSTLYVSNEAYILGLADVIGELRRLVLDSLMDNDASDAQRYFTMMQEIYELLQLFDFPDAMIQIRKKRDAGRGIIERTRADLAVAVRSIGLEQALKKSER